MGWQNCELKLAGGVDYGGMNESVRCVMREVEDVEHFLLHCNVWQRRERRWLGY